MGNQMSDDWQDFWHDDDRPDAMSWVILMAGVVAIILMVCAWVFLDTPEISLATRMMTER